MTWPKTVPILDASDIFKGLLDGPNNTHCLIGWCLKTFGGSLEYYRVFNAIARACSGYRGIAEFNDSPEITRSQIANRWNRVMAREFGYVTGNPEAKG